jgi:hypothetical protein
MLRRSFPAFILLAIMPLALQPRAVRAEPVLPNFSPEDFVSGAPIDNPFFPLTPGTTFRWEGTITNPEDGDTSQERDEDFVTFQTKVIGGVTARVVHARVFNDGDLTEDTLDYYAQDKSGNVWYLGEDTKEFELDDEGNVIGTDTTGSWHTGVNGAKPGFIMPAVPSLKVGFEYFQENAPADEALDRATILALDETVTVPFGTFNGVLKTLEETDLEPGVQEQKFYAPGVGNILVHEDIQPNGKPLNTLALVSVTSGPSNAIPLPPAAWTGLGTMSLMLAAQGLRRIRRSRR